ncbi:hypothetical protein [Streptomyces cylindrosporus]|nr:hypothetical protein [Streptomyces cylindrosporus]
MIEDHASVESPVETSEPIAEEYDDPGFAPDWAPEAGEYRISTR